MNQIISKDWLRNKIHKFVQDGPFVYFLDSKYYKDLMGLYIWGKRAFNVPKYTENQYELFPLEFYEEQLKSSLKKHDFLLTS